MTTGPMSPAAATSYLTRPEGRVAAYDVDGAGPLVVLVPGMGDPRSIHRFLIPAEALGDLTAPALIIVGEADPDVGDQRAEAASIAEALHGQGFMIPEAGRYPPSQGPDITTPAMIRFADTVNNRA
jgi:pimeloyl-ACP methyl ester carboxylesterase